MAPSSGSRIDPPVHSDEPVDFSPHTMVCPHCESRRAGSPIQAMRPHISLSQSKISKTKSCVLQVPSINEEARAPKLIASPRSAANTSPVICSPDDGFMTADPHLSPHCATLEKGLVEPNYSNLQPSSSSPALAAQNDVEVRPCDHLFPTQSNSQRSLCCFTLSHAAIGYPLCSLAVQFVSLRITTE